MASKTVLVVGERANSPGSGRSFIPERWLWSSLRLGAFRDPVSRKKLLSVGLDLADSSVETVNLTPPAPQGTRWDHEFAERVASLVEIEDHAAVFLCGARVARAFGTTYCPGTRSWVRGQVGMTVVSLPHPSGLCRFWNSRDSVERLMGRVAEILEGARATCRR